MSTVSISTITPRGSDTELRELVFHRLSTPTKSMEMEEKIKIVKKLAAQMLLYLPKSLLEFEFTCSFYTKKALKRAELYNDTHLNHDFKFFNDSQRRDFAGIVNALDSISAVMCSRMLTTIAFRADLIIVSDDQRDDLKDNLVAFKRFSEMSMMHVDKEGSTAEETLQRISAYKIRASPSDPPMLEISEAAYRALQDVFKHCLFPPSFSFSEFAKKRWRCCKNLHLPQQCSIL